MARLDVKRLPDDLMQVLDVLVEADPDVTNRSDYIKKWLMEEKSKLGIVTPKRQNESNSNCLHGVLHELSDIKETLDSLKTEKVHIQFLLDKSSSMCAIKKPTIELFNSLSDSLRSRDNVYVTYWTFSTSVSKEWEKQDASKLSTLSERNYHPYGMTALYEAAYKAILESQKDKESDTTLVVVLTDGENTTNYEFKSLLQKQVSSLPKNIHLALVGPKGLAKEIAKYINLPNDWVHEYDPTAEGINAYSTRLVNSTNNYITRSPEARTNFNEF